MKIIFLNIVLMLVIILFTSKSSAQGIISQDSPKKTRISLEIDPATFTFNGYSLHLRVQPKHSEHLLIGAGIYAMDMPDFLVDLNSKNKNKSWDVRLNQGYGLFVEHHFYEVNKNWFVGGQTSIQQYNIEQENVNGQSKFTNALLMGYGGYTLQPFRVPIYIKAWGGLGYTSKISGSNTLNNGEYDISPITMFLTVHLGYTF